MTSPQSARVIGMLTFFVGVFLLLLVFFRAQADLARPLTGSPAAMGALLARQIGLLFIMGYAGSSLAGRGVQLFQSSLNKSVVVEDAANGGSESRRELPSSTVN